MTYAFRVIQFAIAFGTRRDAAEQAVDALTADGYQAELQESGLRFVVTATADEPLLDLNEAAEQVARVADKLGGDYMGHGGLSIGSLRSE